MISIQREIVQSRIEDEGTITLREKGDDIRTNHLPLCMKQEL